MAAHPRLLLVDDDESKRSLLAHFLLLEFCGASVVECISGAAAIEHLLLHPIDALITDHSMQPVDGVELTQWVRARFPRLPIVMVTGNATVAQRALAAGADLVLETARYLELGPAVRRLLSRG